MDKIFNDGLAPDTRTDEQKAKDYKHDQLAGAIVLNWFEKPMSEWKKYTPREQDGSLSCCGQSAAKAIEILNYEVQSAHPIYRSRSNYPQGGMYLANLGAVSKSIGTTLESLDPSQMQNESTMNRDITVPTPIKIGGYVTLTNPKDIDAIAEAIELHKHCILIVHCNKGEWTAKPVFNGATINFGHAICAVDYFLHNGVKTLLIEDSTGHSTSFDKKGQRLITDDFLNARFEGAMYFTLESPLFPITQTLRFGTTDPQVRTLQTLLKKSGDFPQSQVVTQYFGSITLGAVKSFQKKHGLSPDGIVGPLTRAKLLLV